MLQTLADSKLSTFQTIPAKNMIHRGSSHKGNGLGPGCKASLLLKILKGTLWNVYHW